MNKTTKIATIITVVMISFSSLFAENPTHEFKNNSDLAIEVERVAGGKVAMHLRATDPNQYQYIIIERSNASSSYFARIRYIDPSSEKFDANNYMQKTDNYPISMRQDSYYRIVTIDKDGVERAYPATQLAGVGLY